MTNLRKLLLTVAAFAVLQEATARAASISLDIVPNTLFTAPGDTVAYTGTITNLKSYTVYLNSFDVNAGGPFLTDPGVFDPTLLFLTANQVISIPFDLFTLTVDSAYAGPWGLQPLGTFTLFGGVDGDAQELIGSQTFGLVVTPEPGTFALLGLPLVLALIKRRR
jgi:hypothetical protein